MTFQTGFDPFWVWSQWATMVGGDAVLAVLLCGALFLVLRAQFAARERRWREDEAAATAERRMTALDTRLMTLAEEQQKLTGAMGQGLSQGLGHIKEAATSAQADTLQLVETRMETVSKRLTDHVADHSARANAALADTTQALARAMEARLAETQAVLGESMQGSAEKTALSLGALTERLEAIDRAQSNIEKLSGDVLGLQDILSNKQARGRFGEIQLNDLIIDALPPSAYSFQVTLSNGRRVDALLKLPDPPGPVAVDAKFPLEPYEALRQATNPAEVQAAERAFRAALRAHVAAIAERYVIPGETSDGALMFLPSEAVYAELHARFAEVVRESFSKRVWIVSPTTLMATLLTMRAVLRDASIRERSDDLRREIGHLAKDVERLAERAEKLQTSFGQSEKALREIGISAQKSLKRARRLSGVDPEEDEPETLEASVASPFGSEGLIDANGAPLER